MELARIEQRAKLKLPRCYRQFLEVVGGSVVDAEIVAGPHSGEDVAEFLSVDDILLELEELDRAGLVPIAVDMMGNRYFLSSKLIGACEVVLWDYERGNLVKIARTFDEFLESLGTPK